MYSADAVVSVPGISKGKKLGSKTSKQMKAWMNHLMGEMDSLHRKVRYNGRQWKKMRERRKEEEVYGSERWRERGKDEEMR